MTEQEIKSILNQVLKALFYKILRLQEKSVSKSSNHTISRTEMHILEAVQTMPKATLTSIAEEMNITKATVSVSVTGLVQKQYLKKEKSEGDQRVNIIKLTEKGAFSCKKHQQFHDAMVQSILNEFDIEEHPQVIKSLQALLDFFSGLDV